MKKRNKQLILMILSAGLLFTGCGNTNGSSSNESTDTSNNSNNIIISIDEKPDMYGQVRKIVGNEVILDLAEIPENIGGSDRSNMSKKEGEKKKDDMQNITQEQRQEMMKDKIKFTGETATIMVPVGIPIFSTKQGEVSQLDLADIQQETFIQVWFNEDGNGGNKTVKSIRIIQGR